MWIPREIEGLISAVAKERSVVAVTGCRQAGKTSLLEHLFPSYPYLSLDSPLVADEAERGADALLERLGAPVILDEVQYAPHLLRHVKARVDRKRGKKGQFFITGSQKFQLMQGVTESLAGRVGVITCQSLSGLEIERHLGLPLQDDLLLDTIVRGGYPEVYANALSPQRFFGDYLATYLERDVRNALSVRDLRDFGRFMRLLAGRVGQLVSAHALAAELGLAAQTVRSWLSVLEASNIIYFLQPYHNNLGKRLVKTSKLYFMDSGLACYLVGIEHGQMLDRSALLGAMFENFCVTQVVRWYSNRGRAANLCFFRNHEGQEVDLIRLQAGGLHLMECKWSSRPIQHTKGFAALRRLVGDAQVLSETLISPARGFARMHTGANRGDAIDFSHLG